MSCQILLYVYLCFVCDKTFNEISISIMKSNQCCKILTGNVEWRVRMISNMVILLLN